MMHKAAVMDSQHEDNKDKTASAISTEIAFSFQIDKYHRCLQWLLLQTYVLKTNSIWIGLMADWATVINFNYK